jgi:hypothetical protein
MTAWPPRKWKLAATTCRQGSYLAGINRFKKVVTDYQQTSHTPEALYRLAEAYMALGVVSEAQTAAAVLGHNYPQQRMVQGCLPAGGQRRAPAGCQRVLLDHQGLPQLHGLIAPSAAAQTRL